MCPPDALAIESYDKRGALIVTEGKTQFWLLGSLCVPCDSPLAEEVLAMNTDEGATLIGYFSVTHADCESSSGVAFFPPREATQ